MSSGRPNSKRSNSRQPTGKGGYRSAKLLTAEQERLLVEQLCAIRKQIQRQMQPVLSKAPEDAKLSHFDQQMAYYECIGTGRQLARTRIAKLLFEYNELKHELVLANIPWVTKLSRSCRATAISEEDLFQEGMCGLLKAIDRFEAKRGLRLMTYATWYIREAMQQVRARQSHIVALSAHDQTLMGEIEARRTEFQHEHQRTPSAGELGHEVDRKVDFLRRLQSATTPAVSLERNSTEGTIPIIVEDPAREYEHAESVASVVSKLLATLPSRERFVVTRRYGLEGKSPVSLETLGTLLKVSKERVRQLQRQALRRMQETADQTQVDPAVVWG